MAFTIPNVSVAGYTDQAEPDSVDIDILTAGHSMTGVVSGCAVTAQASPNMTVAVASGTISVLGTNVAVTSGNLTVGAADATLARKDIIVVNSSGTKSITTGTPAAQPLKSAIPASSVVLAEVYVPALSTTVGSTQITDKRVIVQAAVSTTMRLIDRKTSDQSVTSSTVMVNATSLVLPVAANEVWKVEFALLCDKGPGGMQVRWTFPSGGYLSLVVPIATGGSPADVATGTSPTSDQDLGTETAGDRRAHPWSGTFVNGGTGGSLQLQFAQDTSNGTPCIMKANSTLWAAQLV